MPPNEWVSNVNPIWSVGQIREPRDLAGHDDLTNALSLWSILNDGFANCLKRRQEYVAITPVHKETQVSGLGDRCKVLRQAQTIYDAQAQLPFTARTWEARSASRFSIWGVVGFRWNCILPLESTTTSAGAPPSPHRKWPFNRLPPLNP